MKFITNINLNQHELQNGVIHKLASAPGSPVAGQIYYNTVDNKVFYYDGSGWIDISGDISDVAGSGAINVSVVDGVATVSIDAASGAGEGTMSIAHFNLVNSADSLATPDSLVYRDGSGNFAAARITVDNLTLNNDPAIGTDVVNFGFVETYVESKTPKSACRLATTANITLSGVQTIDGVIAAIGDRVLVKDQTTSRFNGIYYVNSGAWIRTPDADLGTKLKTGSTIFIQEGTTNAATGWLLTTYMPITIGTTPLSFIQITENGLITAGDGLTKTGTVLDVNVDDSTIEINSNTLRVKDLGIGTGKIADNAINEDKLDTSVAGDGLTGGGGNPLAVGAGTGIIVNANDIEIDFADQTETEARTITDKAVTPADLINFSAKKAFDVGDGGSTSFVLTHNLNTRDVEVKLRMNSSPYDEVVADVSITSVNTVTVSFVEAPSTNQFRAIIIG